MSKSRVIVNKSEQNPPVFSHVIRDEKGRIKGHVNVYRAVDLTYYATIKSSNGNMTWETPVRDLQSLAAAKKAIKSIVKLAPLINI